jgi:hypothetical protein
VVNAVNRAATTTDASGANIASSDAASGRASLSLRQAAQGDQRGFVATDRGARWPIDLECTADAEQESVHSQGELGHGLQKAGDAEAFAPLAQHELLADRQIDRLAGACTVRRSCS